jgi:hypothetical protein
MLAVLRDKYAVWHAYPSEYADAYWITTMKNAYKKKWEQSCFYEIRNLKARRALRCSFCKKHPSWAVYDKLELYCEDHLPQSAVRCACSTSTRFMTS